MRATLLLSLALASGSAAGDELSDLPGDFWEWRRFHQPLGGDDIPRIEYLDDPSDIEKLDPFQQ